VGHEPGLFQASHELVFTDPRDDAYIPQTAVVKKRIPSLAALRAKKASVAAEHTVRAEHLGHADDGCHPHIFFGPSKQKHEVERTAKTSGLEQQVPPEPSQSVHLAGAAVLGLRKLARGANDVSAYLQTIYTIPHKMMQTAISDVSVANAVNAPLAPGPPSASSRPTATRNGKRPIPSSMQVLMVPYYLLSSQHGLSEYAVCCGRWFVTHDMWVELAVGGRSS